MNFTEMTPEEVTSYLEDRATEIAKRIASQMEAVPHRTDSDDTPGFAVVEMTAAIIAFCAVVDNAAGDPVVPAEPMAPIAALFSTLANDLPTFLQAILTVRDRLEIPYPEGSLENMAKASWAAMGIHA